MWQQSHYGRVNSDQLEDSDILTICDGSKDEEPREMDASVTI